MQKDKKNSFELPAAEMRNAGDGTTAIGFDNDSEDRASDAGEATSSPQCLHDPKLSFPTEEETHASYHTEEFKPEPSKFSELGRRTKPTRRGNQQAGLRRQHPAPRQTTHVSSRRDKKHRYLELALLLFAAVLLVVAYQHRSSLETIVDPWLQQLFQYVKAQVGDGGDSLSGVSGITEISDDRSVDKPPQLALSEMECHDLMPRVEKAIDVTGLEFEAQFAVAECYYLRGDYLQSYRLLQKNEQQLRDGSLLLYTILLLKRRQFSAVRALLRGKCVAPDQHQQFFPCLAQALLHWQQSGQVSFSTKPSSAHKNNPYSAVAWLLQALHHRTYDLSSKYIAQATSAGERGKRRTALSYVYETLIRFTYLHGSVAQLKKLHALAVYKLQDEHTAAHWWVSLVAKLGTAKVKKKEVLYVLSSKDNFARMYDNFDFLDIIGVESIYFGYSVLWENVIKRIQQYQKRVWKAEAREAIQLMQQWRTRILVARKRTREVIKNLKAYANNYGKDYFYCSFLGIALMNMPGKSGAHTSIALLAHSLSLRDSWDNNYAYALALLKNDKIAQLTSHMRKLKQLAITPAHKKWLFLLRAEIKIRRGRNNVAINDLRGYIAKHPHSFVAHRLLVTAYMRASRPREAVVVRKAYDRLQKRVPYYSTEEGLSSPIGALALGLVDLAVH